MSYHNGPRVVTEGLVLYVDAGNRKSYPGNGTNWKDLSVRGSDGTVVNPSYSAANGGVFYFDGSTSYATFAGPLESGNNFVISSWYYPTRINTSYDMIYSGVDNTDLQLFFHAVSKKLTTSIENIEIATNFELTANTINKWYNIAWRYDGVSRDIYINGELASSDANTTSFVKSGNTVALGATDTGGLKSQGYYGNLSVFSRALSPNEIRQNYNALKGRFNL